MKRIILTFFFYFLIVSFSYANPKEDLPRIAIWDLTARGVSDSYIKELTSILISEVSKLGKYEVYSQETIRNVANVTAERMKLGCTDVQCLMTLGQLDFVKLISGSVGKIGSRYLVSLQLFDTVQVKSVNSVSDFCNSEDKLIELVQLSVRTLLGESEKSKYEPNSTETPLYPCPEGYEWSVTFGRCIGAKIDKPGTPGKKYEDISPRNSCPDGLVWSPSFARCVEKTPYIRH